MHSQLANPAWSCGVRWGLQLSLLLFSWYRSPGESRLQRKAPSYGALTPCSCSHVAARSRSGVCVDKVSLRRWDTGWDLKGNEAISKASIEHVCMASGDGVNSAVRFSCAEINRPATSESSKRSTQIHQQWRFRSNLPYRSRSDLKSQPTFLWCVYGNKGFFSTPPRSISLQGAFGNETAGAWFYCHMLCLALMKDKSSLNYSIT